MTTVVNNPPAESNSGGIMSMVIGLIIVLIIAYVFIVFGLPVLRNMGGGTQINVPDKIDVNVNQGDSGK